MKQLKNTKLRLVKTTISELNNNSMLKIVGGIDPGDVVTVTGTNTGGNGGNTVNGGPDISIKPR